MTESATEFLANLGIELDVEEYVVNLINEGLVVRSLAELVGKKKSASEPRFIKISDECGKLPNQAKFLLNALGDEPMTYEEWGAAAVEFGMSTKQDPARIAAYYRKQLEDAGLIERA